MVVSYSSLSLNYSTQSACDTLSPFTCSIYILCMCVIFLQSYEQAFEQIKEATGITDIDKLVTKFIEGVSLVHAVCDQQLHAVCACLQTNYASYKCLHVLYPLHFLTTAVEDQNFALFNYVNELNGEIEMILKQIEQVSLKCSFSIVCATIVQCHVYCRYVSLVNLKLTIVYQ